VPPEWFVAEEAAQVLDVHWHRKNQHSARKEAEKALAIAYENYEPA
jgi:hypothetical protein